MKYLVAILLVLIAAMVPGLRRVARIAQLEMSGEAVMGNVRAIHPFPCPQRGLMSTCYRAEIAYQPSGAAADMVFEKVLSHKSTLGRSPVRVMTPADGRDPELSWWPFFIATSDGLGFMVASFLASVFLILIFDRIRKPRLYRR